LRRLWVDVVEKVGGTLLERNNRIIRGDFLNRTCAFDPHFESMLHKDPPKIFFDNIDHGLPLRLRCQHVRCTQDS
jgi:hypothetical protein